MSDNVSKWLEQLTLEEKAGLCSGEGFWYTKAVERLGIESWMMSDGPHGLRVQPDDADHYGIGESLPATCFPSASALASSWDRKLVGQLGNALGIEARSCDLSVVLGPGVNLKRSPLCGRNFEYFSEDPFLAGELATSYVKSLQAQGVGTSLKHFAVNNQEHRRMSVDAVVDDRTLRELYLPAFEKVVREASPWTVMCSYNRLNGTYTGESHWLLTEVLRDQWGFDGVVVSDWGAVNNRVKGVAAGLDLEMPGVPVRDRAIVEAVNKGDLEEAALDRAVERLLKLYLKTREQTETLSFDEDEHHQLARRVAADSFVLLKNNDNLLPLNNQSKVGFIGEFFERPRYQGGGSSHVHPTRIESLQEALDEAALQYQYAKGFEIESERLEEGLLKEARDVAASVDIVVLYLGLPDRYETEGFDREHLNLPENQVELLKAISEVNKKVVVLLANGAPVVLPWIDQAAALLETHLGGQALGSALADVLYGKRSPSGKLSETIPYALEDTPSFEFFHTPQRPNNTDRVDYGEGLLVGYRYYDTRGVEPHFPFGFGLSYSNFDYANLKLSKTAVAPGDTLTVSFDITNSGDVDGSEVAQLYVTDNTGVIAVPAQQLKGFDKVYLAKGETARVDIELEWRDFAYWNVDHQRWAVPAGEFEIRVAASSRDIRLTQSVTSQGDQLPPLIGPNTLVGDLIQQPAYKDAFYKALEKHIEVNPELARSVTMTSDDPMENGMALYMPLRALLSFSDGTFTEEHLEEVLDHLRRV